MSCCTGLFSLFYQEQNVTHLHLRLCYKTPWEQSFSQNCPRHPRSIQNSLTFLMSFPISFGVMKVWPTLNWPPIISLTPTSSWKALFTETPGWECRNWCWHLVDVHKRCWQLLCPSLSHAGNDGQSLALSSWWHSKPGGGKGITSHKPVFTIPILKWLVDVRWLSSAAALCYRAKWKWILKLLLAGRLSLGHAPLNQSICNSVKATDKYNESQEFPSIWKCFPKWLKLNFIKRNP